MKSLWTDWPLLRRRMRAAEDLLLCLDYDGTIAPIARHPAQARLPVKMARLLERLVRQPRVRVALVSGRSIRDLKTLVGIRGVSYIGNHGLEFHGPTLRAVHPVAQRSRALLRPIARRLKTALRIIPGAWVEEKGLTLSLHWRNVPPGDQRRFHRLVARHTVAPLEQGAIRVTRGKRTIEVRPPVRWGKGDAVARLLRSLPHGRSRAPALIIYLGDDETDEEAFRMVNRLGGVSIWVGKPVRRTAARYRLSDPQEVWAWLEQAGLMNRRHPDDLVTARG